jgi:acetoin utilization protein AcuB
MQVHECMIVDPITVSPKTTCAEAFRLLRTENLPALPVVDNAGKLVGIVTETDLLDVAPVIVRRIHTIGPLSGPLTIEAAMNRRVITVLECCPLEDAARILVDNKAHSLLVMRENQVVGIVTQIEILRTIMEAFGGRSEGLRITIRLSEDNGELGAITDGIIHLGGRLINLSTFWGAEPVNRIITLKVQGVKRDDMLLMLERTIGVQVIDFCEGGAEANQHTPLLSTAHAEVFPIETLDSKIPWPLEPK